MFYLTGTAWDEVLKLKTLNSLGVNIVKSLIGGLMFFSGIAQSKN
jgi:hypothetical protein